MGSDFIKTCELCGEDFACRSIKPTPKATTGKIWVWTNKKTVCPHNNCPFKSGKRPCLFYFEYKDGTATCPGARFVNAKGGIKNELAKGSD